MDTIREEKRSHLRVKAKIKVDIAEKIHANSIDVGEGGLSFSSQETISSPALSLQVCFPDQRVSLKAKARLVWRRDTEAGACLYGVEFVNLKEAQKKTLRAELIKTQIGGLLQQIQHPEIRENVCHFFLKDILDYISDVTRLTSQLSNKKSYSQELEKELEHLNNQILLKGYCLELLLADKSIMQRVKNNFRYLVSTWAYKSTIVKRAFEKPRGYPGDYRMLEAVYDNRPVSKKIGCYFDTNFLKSPYAVALRLRKDHLREMLRVYIAQGGTNPIRILNIACGSCREIRELVPALRTHHPIVFTCLDLDQEALNFAHQILSSCISSDIKYKFVKNDVSHILKDKLALQSLGKQNFIYSIGLIDYLPDRVLKKLIAALYERLDEGGKLILTHKNKDKTFPPISPDWFCNWQFVPRDKYKVIELIHESKIPHFSLSVESDSFNYIYYFTIIKKSSRIEKLPSAPKS
ncbi:MAG: PilZ domain-containing protein [Candidatus Omnitrophota bacterium]|nr:MAG: PilZ domain-containing protein [Candidatus Omnitrophota bacterium]